MYQTDRQGGRRTFSLIIFANKPFVSDIRNTASYNDDGKDQRTFQETRGHKSMATLVSMKDVKLSSGKKKSYLNSTRANSMCGVNEFID